MPAARKNRPSVAATSIAGVIGMPGWRACTAADTATMTSARSGDASLNLIVATGSTFTASPTTVCSSACTTSGATPGKIRQFTFAVAIYRNAHGASPAASSVGTQVVRTKPTYVGLRDNVAA